MADIESMYRRVDGRVLIEIKLSSIMQLFNSFDQAPFHEKELDSAAEQYIVDTVRDLPAKTEFRIIIYLPPEIAASEQALHLAPAIHNHFQYRMLVSDRKFRQRAKYGRSAFVIGLCFLFVIMLAWELVQSFSNSVVVQFLANALLIIGWAAMWEPVTVLLYDLWPITQTKKIYEKISTMQIDVLPFSP